MINRNKQILSLRMDEDIKEHIKGFAKPSVNAWAIKILKKASGYPTKGKLR